MPDKASDYLQPLLSFAAARIPREKHRETPLYILCTAGMRLLPERWATRPSDILGPAPAPSPRRPRCSRWPGEYAGFRACVCQPEARQQRSLFIFCCLRLFLCLRARILRCRCGAKTVVHWASTCLIDGLRCCRSSQQVAILEDLARDVPAEFDFLFSSSQAEVISGKQEGKRG